MTDRDINWMLTFLADEATWRPAAPELEPELDEVITEAALLLSDLRAGADDLAGAAVWQQVARDTASHEPQAKDADPAEWSLGLDQPETHDERRPR